jgi:hypothetical protein
MGMSIELRHFLKFSWYMLLCWFIFQSKCILKLCCTLTFIVYHSKCTCHYKIKIKSVLQFNFEIVIVSFLVK